jgi:hypothetical protein
MLRNISEVLVREDGPVYVKCSMSCVDDKCLRTLVLTKGKKLLGTPLAFGRVPPDTLEPTFQHIFALHAVDVSFRDEVEYTFGVWPSKDQHCQHRRVPWAYLNLKSYLIPSRWIHGVKNDGAIIDCGDLEVLQIEFHCCPRPSISIEDRTKCTPNARWHVLCTML